MIPPASQHAPSSAADEIRIHPTRKTDNFTLIDNALLRNKALSFKARGILCHLLSHRAGWTIRMSELRTGGVDGEAAIRSGIEELIAAGHVTRERIKGEMGRMAGWRYTVFEDPIPAETRKSSLGSADTRFSTSGESRPKNTKGENTNNDRVVPKGTTPAASTAGVVYEQLTGLNPGDLAISDDREDDASHESAAPAPSPGSAPSPAPSDAPTLALDADDDPQGKTFPWKQLMAIVTRIVPDVKMPIAGVRRDAAMKQFWRKHGKTVGCFELLAQKVAASDYLMARNGHAGQNGRPFTWGWIFSKNERGEVRADAIMEGGYTTEGMAFVLERKAAAAKPKLTKVMLVGVSTASEVNLGEKLADGRDRYRRCDGEMKNGMQVYLDCQ